MNGLQRKKKRTNAKKHYLYNTWCNMRRRCYSPEYYLYHRYGGRGIKVCGRWLTADGFWNFVDDMGERPEGTSLDRIDNNKNYEPSNCRWATPHTQQSNKSNNTKRVGVSIQRRSNPKWKTGWVAEIMVKGVRHNKLFTNYEDAVRQREEWELTLL